MDDISNNLQVSKTQDDSPNLKKKKRKRSDSALQQPNTEFIEYFRTLQNNIVSDEDEAPALELANKLKENPSWNVNALIDQTTLLILASKHGKFELVKKLVTEFGANVNKRR